MLRQFQIFALSIALLAVSGCGIKGPLVLPPPAPPPAVKPDATPSPVPAPAPVNSATPDPAQPARKP